MRFRSKMCAIWISFAFSATGYAQSTVTTSGTTTTNTVPVFNGNATVTNSVITQSGSNVGIGTTSPLAVLDVNGSIATKGANALWQDNSNHNLAIGSTAFPGTDTPQGGNIGANNIGVGLMSLNANTTGGTNTAVGVFSMRYNTTGGANSAFGFSAMSALQTGSNNNAFGWGTLQANVSGVANAGFGYQALYSTTGNNNSAFGGGWGSTGTGRSITTGNSNSVFGSYVGGTTLSTGSNNILIGTDHSTDTPAANTSNFLNLGNTIYATNMYNSVNTGGVGFVGLGTATPGARLEVNGNVKLTAGAGASITYSDGTQQTTAWTGVLCGGDYAEDVETKGQRKQYDPGDVLVISGDSDSDVEKSVEPYSTSVAGIYATKPGVIGRRESMAKVSDDLPMAMVGIVPTKVSAENGPIRRGDLLVTSSRLGFAMKGTDRSRMLGAVIGKAMGSLDSGTGTIEVLVTLQ